MSIRAAFLSRTGWLYALMAALLAASLLVGVHGVRVLDAAKAAQTGATAMLSQGDGAQAQITLPDAWGSQDARAEGRVYRFEVALSPPQDGSDVLLYVPFYDPHIRVALNGFDLFDSRNQNAWPGPTSLSTTLILLPRDRLLDGPNSITIRMVAEHGRAEPVRGALSQVMIGTPEQLTGLFYLRRSLDHALKPILLGGQVLLAVYGLFSFALRPQDTVFGWLGLMMAATSALGLGAMADAIPNFRPVIQTVYLLAPVSAFALLGFALSLMGKGLARPVLLAMAGVVGANFICVYGLGMAHDATFGRVSAPVILLCFLVSTALILRQMMQKPSLELALFLMGLLALIAGWLHDVGAMYGMVDTGLVLAQVSRLFTLAGLTVLIFRRQAATADAFDRAGLEQQRRLTEQERELTRLYALDRDKAERAAVEEERARITRDLHDGVASHLLTISTLAQSRPDVPPQIKSSAQTALVDIRLIIDALSVEGGDLLFFLGIFRDRCVAPLISAGVEVDWSMVGLTSDLSVSRETALHVFRILQEALTNAVRHGDGGQISARCTALPDGLVQITITNRVGAVRDDPLSSGLGLENMRRRAGLIGGETSTIRRDDVFVFTLKFPTNPAHTPSLP